MPEKTNMILLCVMPFCPVRAPQLGVSLLKSALEKNGYSTRIFYFNLKMVQELGLNVYDRINGEDLVVHRLVGELVFSEYLFGKPTDICRIGHILRDNPNCSEDTAHRVIEEIQLTKRIVPRFIEECAIAIEQQMPSLVGFSTSYFQNCSSLCLAKKVKETMDLPIIFGGANCEGEMGFTLLSHFPQVDFVCSGDGDIAFVEFTKHLIQNKTLPKINGILDRNSTPLEVSLTSPQLNLDNLPLPDFNDYFNSVRDVVNEHDIKSKIVMETSRGCWWGELSHCTFCGLNGSTMKYRSKSPDRVIHEMDELMKSYGIKEFQFVDNILDPAYFKELFPKITEKDMGAWIFYETKANLSRQQLLCMKDAGVAAIQPGIESLSDTVLKIMYKGSTALQNIHVLKLCKEIGIWSYWNIITGFPGEPAEEYSRMSDLIPLLTHLDPPTIFGSFQLSRYSPYYKEAEKYGITNVRSLKLYKSIYPFDETILSKMTYFFEHDYSDKRNPSLYTTHLGKKIKEWKRLWNEHPPELNMVRTKNMTIIRDTRPCAIQHTHILGNEEAYVYDICEAPQNIDTIYSNMHGKYPQISHEDIHSILMDFCAKKIAVGNNNQYLSLAISIAN